MCMMIKTWNFFSHSFIFGTNLFFFWNKKKFSSYVCPERKHLKSYLRTFIIFFKCFACLIFIFMFVSHTHKHTDVYFAFDSFDSCFFRFLFVCDATNNQNKQIDKNICMCNIFPRLHTHIIIGLVCSKKNHSFYVHSSINNNIDNDSCNNNKENSLKPNDQISITHQMYIENICPVAGLLPLDHSPIQTFNFLFVCLIPCVMHTTIFIFKFDFFSTFFSFFEKKLKLRNQFSCVFFSVFRCSKFTKLEETIR